MEPLSDADEKALTRFVYLEARLADESRYSEWEALWDEDAVYWVPRGAGDFDPERDVSHVYDNRKRLATRVRMLNTGYRHSQVPPSPMRRVISNLEIERIADGFEIASNFILLEQNLQSHHRLQTWAGRTIHRVRRQDDGFRLYFKKVMLVNGDEPLPNLSFLI